MIRKQNTIQQMILAATTLAAAGAASAQPINDNCSNPIAISSYGLTPYGTGDATSDGPQACAFIGNDIWFSYTACASGEHTLSTCSGTFYDTALVVYSGACGGLIELGCNDDSCGLGSSVTFTANAGTTYRFQVGGYSGRSGPGILDLSGPACCPMVPVVQGPVVNPANGHTYYRLSDSTWTCAEFTAASLGAHLVTINDAAENDFILNTFANAPGVARVWMGLTDRDVEGSFAWTSGESVGFTNWTPGEPNNSNGGENFGLMFSGSGRWNDGQDFSGLTYGIVEIPCSPIDVVQGPILNQANGHTYYRLSSSSWTCAQAAAVDLGGNLATINDAAENTFVATTFAAAADSSRVWIGLTDRDAEGSFTWVSGAPAGFTNWNPGEPNDANGEDYTILYSDSVWNDAPDSYGSTYGVVETPCQPVSVVQGPIVNPANGHTYYRLSSSNWGCAEAAAIELGGRLVTINNAAENAFVLNTFVNAPGSGLIWLGVTDRDSEGSFTWVSGQSSSYTNWAPGEPNNHSQDEDYALMYTVTGQWNDVNGSAGSPGFEIYGVVEIPGVCGCDWNHSGAVNSQDFFDFVTAFFAGNADYNGNGVTTSQDFFDFITCFFAPPVGC